MFLRQTSSLSVAYEFFHSGNGFQACLKAVFPSCFHAFRTHRKLACVLSFWLPCRTAGLSSGRTDFSHSISTTVENVYCASECLLTCRIDTLTSSSELTDIFF